MKDSLIPALLLTLLSFSLPACSRLNGQEQQPQQEPAKILVTCPKVTDVTVTRHYVCQIRSQRHINVCAFANGYIEGVSVKEGQAVKKGDPMFKILPTLYEAKRDAEQAEVTLVGLEFKNTQKLAQNNVVSQQEVALNRAKLAKAQAHANLATAELSFTQITAPFDGIVDRLEQRQGSLIKEGDVLTSLSDNKVMWVYFNVPEARYLEYISDPEDQKEEQEVELVLANGKKFPQTGKIGAIEANFNSETGNIPFRADFRNPDGLLRHGQTGNVLIHRTLKDALVIPQQATFEILDKRFVFVVDKENVAREREIVVQNELEDIFIIKQGLSAGDKIVLEGVRQVRDGQKLQYQFRHPEQVIANQKNKAE